eukprot:m.144124 g.144124  ORF g.144124 m.144124 type:complete len:184 (+) comp16035_c1_seq5:695-1246(+)
MCALAYRERGNSAYTQGAFTAAISAYSLSRLLAAEERDAACEAACCLNRCWAAVKLYDQQLSRSAQAMKQRALFSALDIAYLLLNAQADLNSARALHSSLTPKQMEKLIYREQEVQKRIKLLQTKEFPLEEKHHSALNGLEVVSGAGDPEGRGYQSTKQLAVGSFLLQEEAFSGCLVSVNHAL